MVLDELVRHIDGAQLDGAGSTEILDITHDSRSVENGSLFCCVPGHKADGHDYASMAVQAGAVALLCERPVRLGVAEVLVPDVRRAMGPAAAALFDWPSRSTAVVGVTGTNGKTTTTHFIAGMLDAAGWSCGVIGTLSGARTTPEGPDLQRELKRLVSVGRRAVAMEVSSHALDLHRVDGTRFAVAAFTNLSPDHLDHHGDMERYFAAKARLFTPQLTDRAVIDVDSEWGVRLAEQTEATGIPVRRVSLEDAGALELTGSGAQFTWRGHHVRSALTGRFNVSNALVAAGVAAELGVEDTTIVEALRTPPSVPGRMERIDAGQPFTVLIDYAHTPDGLAAVLHAAQELAASQRVLVTFGCGGDRDATKRPLMGAVASQLADHVVLTADNSRSEPTEGIIEAIRAGAMGAHGRAQRIEIEPDRAAAIAAVIDAAAEGDVVVVAGKGHEATQILGDRVEPFDDRVVARDVLAGRGWRR